MNKKGDIWQEKGNICKRAIFGKERALIAKANKQVLTKTVDCSLTKRSNKDVSYGLDVRHDGSLVLRVERREEEGVGQQQQDGDGRQRQVVPDARAEDLQLVPDGQVHHLLGRQVDEGARDEDEDEDAHAVDANALAVGGRRREKENNENMK